MMLQVEASVSSQGVSKFEVDPSIGKGGLLSKLKASGTATVENVQYGTRTQKSPLPYTTARLQQDGARYLGFSVKQTMSTAQKLFESTPPPQKHDVSLKPVSQHSPALPQCNLSPMQLAKFSCNIKVYAWA